MLLLLLLLQDQALAVAESMVGADEKPLPHGARAKQISNMCQGIAYQAGHLLGKLNPGGQWGTGRPGRRPGSAVVGVAQDAEVRVQRMASLQRATSSVPSF